MKLKKQFKVLFYLNNIENHGIQQNKMKKNHKLKFILNDFTSFFFIYNYIFVKKFIWQINFKSSKTYALDSLTDLVIFKNKLNSNNDQINIKKYMNKN